MRWFVTLVMVGLLLFVPCRASDPLSPDRSPSLFHLRSLGVAFSGRSPGGISSVATLQLFRGLSLDAGIAISRKPNEVELSTLGVPVVCWGEIGTKNIVRFGAGYHWLPLENDGQALVGAGFLLNDPTFDLNFSVDIMYSLDARSRTKFANWLYMFGFTINVPLRR